MTLIDRLSKLEGPDRDVDADIDRAFGLNVDTGALSGPWTKYPAPDHYRETSRYTGSLDAARALMDRLFPGTEYEFTNLYNIVRVTIEMNGKYGGFHGEHVNSLPIAICIALLRAKEAN